MFICDTSPAVVPLQPLPPLRRKFVSQLHKPLMVRAVFQEAAVTIEYRHHYVYILVPAFVHPLDTPYGVVVSLVVQVYAVRTDMTS